MPASCLAPQTPPVAIAAPPPQPWLGLARRFLALALRNDYLSSGRGHQQSRQVLKERRTGRGRPGKAAAAAGPCADAEQAYLSDVARRHRLTSSEEYGLAQRMRGGDAHARHALIEANLGLVVMFARRYQRPGVPLLDLIAEGNIGLIAATKRFDPEMGYRFSTYAKWSVRQAMQQALPGLVGVVRLPARQTAHRTDLGTAAGDAEAGPSELDASGEPPAGAPTWVTSADGPDASQGRAVTACAAGVEETLDTLTIPEDQEPPQLAHTAQRVSTLARALDALCERERVIVSERFALGSDKVTTLDELSQRFGVSVERIRQIESAALRKLAQTLRDAGQSAQTLL